MMKLFFKALGIIPYGVGYLELGGEQSFLLFWKE